MKYSLFSAHKRAIGERALIPEQARGDEEYPAAAQNSQLCATFREVRAQLQFDGAFLAQHEPSGDENLLRLPCFAQSQQSSASLPWPSGFAARVPAPLPTRFARPPTTTARISHCPGRHCRSWSALRSPVPKPPLLTGLCFCWLAARLRVGHPLAFLS